jgi:hypothetical protein
MYRLGCSLHDRRIAILIPSVARRSSTLQYSDMFWGPNGTLIENQGPFPRNKIFQGVKLTLPLHLELTLRISEAIPPLLIMYT